MKKWTIKLIATIIPLYFLLAVSCGGPVPLVTDEDRETEEDSIIPSSSTIWGCVEISTRTVDVKIIDYHQNNGNFRYTLSTSFEENVADDYAEGRFNTTVHEIFFPNDGYNYLCITPIEFPTNLTEFRLIVIIDEVERVVTIHPGEVGCFDVVSPHNNISCTGNGLESDIFGRVKFWTDDLKGCIKARVVMEDHGAVSVTNINTTVPDCYSNVGGGRVSDLLPGTYNYTVNSCPGITTTGSFNVAADECTIININDNSGGGSGTGDLIFWTNTLLDSGPFTVTIPGFGSEQVTGYFSTVPDCGDGSQGGLFSNLPVGNYTSTITNFPGSNGAYNISVVEDQCVQVDFNL